MTEAKTNTSIDFKVSWSVVTHKEVESIKFSAEMNIFGQTCSIVSGQRDRINQICTRGLSHGARKTSTALGNRYNERGQNITCFIKHQ